MAQTRVETPDGQIITVEHPEGATQAEIIAFAQENYSVQEPAVQESPQPSTIDQMLSPLRQAGSALRETFPGPSLTAELTLGLGQQMINAPLAGLRGLGTLATGGGVDQAVEDMQGVSESGFQVSSPQAQEAMQNLGRLGEVISTPLDRMAEGNQALPTLTPGMNPMMGFSSAPPEVPEEFAETRRNPLLSTMLRTAPGAALTALGGRSVANQVRTRNNAVDIVTQADTPSVNDLFNTARVAYREARNQGGRISDDAQRRLVDRITQTERDGSGLRDSHGDMLLITEGQPAAQALQRTLVEAFTRGEALDFNELMALRNLASKVAGNADGYTALLGQTMRNRLDGFMDSLRARDLKPEIDPRTGELQTTDPQRAVRALETARGLWRDANAAAEIERRMQLAESAAGNFVGAGYQNALRIQFKQLNDRIIRGHERGFTQAERQAIRDVAQGRTRIERAARQVGRVAPSSLLNMVAGSAGVGTVGAAMGLNPLVGLAVPVIGQIGRTAATRMGIQGANRALELPLRRSLGQP